MLIRTWPLTFVLLPCFGIAQSDDCANAPLIGPGIHIADGPLTGAGASQADAGNADWYAFDPTMPGYLTITSCVDGTVDTRVILHSGSCGSLTQIAIDDDGCPLGFPPGNSLLMNIPVVPGLTYYIEWDDRWSAFGFTWELIFHTCPIPGPVTFTPTDSTVSVDWPTLFPGPTFQAELGPMGFTPGTGTIISGSVGVDGPPVEFTGLDEGSQYEVYVSLDCSGDPSPMIGPWPFTTTGNPFVANDDCTGAIAIACGDSIAGTTLLATDDAVPGCGTGISAPGVWYSFIGITGSATLSTCNNADYDTKINVYSGDCTTPICEGGNDDGLGCDLTSNVTVLTTAGVEYFVLVQGYDGEIGEFTLSLECSTCVAPQNISISPGDVVANVQWTSANPGSTFVLEYGPQGFTPGMGTAIMGQVGVDGPPVLLTGLTPGTDMELYMSEHCSGDASPIIGPIPFTSTTTPLAPNAFCATPAPIACGTSVMGDTDLGVFSPGPTCASGNITSKGLWYAFTGSGEDVTLSTCGLAGFDTKISVFSGNCQNLVCAAGNDDAVGCAGNTSEVLFFAASGTDHLVLVHGFNANVGTFELSMSCAPPCGNIPPNDVCTLPFMLTPQAIGNCSGVVTATNVCAYASPQPNPPCDQYANIQDVWFSVNTGFDADHTLDVQAVTAGEVNVAIYEACNDPIYIDCFTDVTAPIDLVGLPLQTDLLIRVWNGGGTEAGSFTICDEALLATGTGSNAALDMLRVWPVPARGTLHIGGIKKTVLSLEVLDIQGRILHRWPVQGNTAVLDISEFGAGSYFLCASGSNAVRRFVVE